MHSLGVDAVTSNITLPFRELTRFLESVGMTRKNGEGTESKSHVTGSVPGISDRQDCENRGSGLCNVHLEV